MIVPIWKPVFINGSHPIDPPLTSTVVHLWRADLRQSSDYLNSLWQSLATDEQERANRFRFELHRRRAIASRGILRFVLAHYMDKAPEQLQFSYTAKGKPFLAENCYSDPLEFNVSHSDDLVVYAITLGYSIGVDVEADRAINQLGQILQRYFSPQEQADIKTYPVDQQSQRFFQFWTAKEAVSKATGQGLSEIASVEFEPPSTQSPIWVTQAENFETSWYIQLFEPQTNYFAAVAHHPQVQSLCFFEWRSPF